MVLAAGYQIYDRSVSILPADEDAGMVEEMNLVEYRPFSPNNKLERLLEKPTLTIEQAYPRLDGATAAYPVYAAMAQALYKGVDGESVLNYVNCSTTSEGYDHLIGGRIDMFFGAEPSLRQLEKAKKQNVDIELTPIAKEAFVFLVNEKNPVDSLTIEEIQDWATATRTWTRRCKKPSRTAVCAPLTARRKWSWPSG